MEDTSDQSFHVFYYVVERSKTNKRWATQNDESQNHLARKCDKLHEIIWEIELFIVYARKDWDSVHNSSMENYKPLQWNLWCMPTQDEVSQIP
jgi:hypothetical protein